MRSGPPISNASRQPAIVEIAGSAQARIIRARRRVGAVGKQEGERIDRRGEIVGALSRPLGMLKRQLRQCKDLVAAGGAVGDFCLECGESSLGVGREPLGQIPPGQHDTARFARG